jgi:hypothetical protein
MFVSVIILDKNINKALSQTHSYFSTKRLTYSSLQDLTTAVFLVECLVGSNNEDVTVSNPDSGKRDIGASGNHAVNLGGRNARAVVIFGNSASVDHELSREEDVFLGVMSDRVETVIAGSPEVSNRVAVTGGVDGEVTTSVLHALTRALRHVLVSRALASGTVNVKQIGL